MKKCRCTLPGARCNNATRRKSQVCRECGTVGKPNGCKGRTMAKYA